MPNYYYISDSDYTRTIECDCPLYEGDYLMSLVHTMPWYELSTSSGGAFKWLYKLMVF